MRRFIVAAIASLIVAAFVAGPAAAAPNPSMKGQPNVECGDPGATMGPPGFDSDGFAKAEDPLRRRLERQPARRVAVRRRLLPVHQQPLGLNRPGMGRTRSGPSPAVIRLC